MTLLQINKLHIGFSLQKEAVTVVDGIDLAMESGDRLSIIGESGCGKSLIAMALLGILPPNARVRGAILFDGLDLTAADPKTLRKIRGARLGYVPQSSGTCLNPVLKIGTLAREILRLAPEKAADPRAVDKILHRVGLKAAVAGMYPHQLSEGMKGRALVGLGTCRNPELLIADEPTKGLDQHAKKGLVTLLRDLVEKNNRSLFMITHDLDVVRAMQGTLAVMYAGQFMEIGPVRAILESRPYHPYTAGLLRSHPGNGMHPLPGKPPGLYDPRFGCRFANRCPGADAICTDRVPCLQRIAADHWVRCFHA